MTPHGFRAMARTILDEVLGYRIDWIEHQLAHASSAYHLDEREGKTAIFCNDSKGEYANIFLGYGENGKIERVKEFYNPDSLCGMYAALTD